MLTLQVELKVVQENQLNECEKNIVLSYSFIEDNDQLSKEHV